MAAELDSLDGRKEPQRCTLLVSQFRSCQVSGTVGDGVRVHLGEFLGEVLAWVSDYNQGWML